MKTCKKCGFQHDKDKCPECHKAYMAKWREKNKEHLEIYAKAYYAVKGKPKNKERYAKRKDKAVAYSREYYKNNKEKAQATSRRWKKANADRLHEYEVSRYAANPEQMKAKNRAWRARNPAKRASHEATRRTRMRATSSGKIDYAAIAERDNHICHICNLPVAQADLSFDHVIPLAKGGSHTADNIKVAHKRCNERKKDRILAPHNQKEAEQS